MLEFVLIVFGVSLVKYIISLVIWNVRTNLRISHDIKGPNEEYAFIDYNEYKKGGK